MQNNSNLDMAVSLNAIDILVRILLEQPMPSEVGARFDFSERVIN
jgi:hypothetical protein